MKKNTGTLILLILIISCLSPSDKDLEKTSTAGSQPAGETLLTIGTIHPNSVELQNYRDRPIENIVKKISLETSRRTHIEILVQQLLENVKDPFLKIKIIHDWVSVNIAYDTEGFFSGNIAAIDFNLVRTSGKAVCSGYSLLFQKMAELAGFNTVIISGDSKGYGYNPFRLRDMNVNHAWNAVEIEGHWYLVDTTWDAGHVQGKDFVFDYSTVYLFLDPEYFIFSHFPAEPGWQLLEKPISYGEFAVLHPLKGEFYDFFEIAPDDRSILQSDGIHQIVLEKKKDAMISLVLVNQIGSSFENKAVATEEGNRITVNVAFPAAEKYIVRLFADTEGEQSYLGELIIESTGASEVIYPTKYITFVEKGFRLIEPVNQYLIKGKNNRVSLYAPGWTKAFVAVNNTQIFMDRDENDIFSVTLNNFTASEITVFGSEGNSGSSFNGAIKIFAAP